MFKKWLLENGYTAKQVAELTGLSYCSITSYMQGVRKPTRKNEKKLKEVLGMPDGLFDE